MLGARFRLASLWLSQVARILADHCLRLFVVLHVAQAGASERESAWHLAIALFAFPAVFLAPVMGAICNSLPKRGVLAGSAALGLAVTLFFALTAGVGYACLTLVAVGAALYYPTRYALLPAAARDTHLPLPRVNGWIEMGAVAAIVGGTMLGGGLSMESSAANLLANPWSVPPAVVAALALSVAALAAALPVWFPSDVRRPESPGQAVAGFFRDAGRILRQPDARGSLLAWAGFRGLVAAVTGAFIAVVLSDAVAAAPDTAWQALLGTTLWRMLGIALWIMVGAAAGSLLAGIQGHPSRSLGQVPFAVTALLGTLVWAAAVSTPSWELCLLIGVASGFINVPLSSAYQASVPADARGNGMAILNTAGNLLMAVMAGLMTLLARNQVLSPAGQLWLVAGLTGVGVLLAWRVLYRDSLELALEILIAPMYRVRARGPGVAGCPRSGPLLVVANHSCWFDPLWLGKVLPRRVTPMMTSQFYDLPVLRWLMVHAIRAIRVQMSSYRREAPELREAIAALDRGECVVIFPEGRMRRRAEQSLHPFGQGVWHILHDRPNTPVIVCWIEGGWGSYTSYFGGPPLANKRPDWWRPVRIAVGEPYVLDPALLADDRITRSHLMEVCQMLGKKIDHGLHG